MTTTRDLPLEIKRQYRLVWWMQFWNHSQATPVHLWDGSGDRWSRRTPATALCGKVIDGDSCREVEPERAGYLCKSCVRIAGKGRKAA